MNALISLINGFIILIGSTINVSKRLENMFHNSCEPVQYTYYYTTWKCLLLWPSWKIKISEVFGCTDHRYHMKNDEIINVPNAGQPVSSQSKYTHQQHQYSCSILDVVVQFTGNPTQTEKPDHLQWAEQTTDALEQERRQNNTLTLETAISRRNE